MGTGRKMFSKGAAAAVLIMAAGSVFAVTPVYDSFNYTPGTDLAGDGGWLGTGGGISVGATSLTYTASNGTTVLPPSIGGSVTLTMANAKAEKINSGQFPVTNAVPQVIYYSLVLQVTDPTGAAASGAFVGGFNNTVAAAGTTSVTSAGARLVIGKVSGNTDPLGYNIALQNDVTSAGTSVKTFDVNRVGGTDSASVFIVGAYYLSNSTSGGIGSSTTTDDVAAMWINPDPSTFSLQTPPAPTLTSTGGDLNNISTTGIASFFFRQNASGGKTAVFDDVRFDTSWAAVTPVQWSSSSDGQWSASTNWTSNVTPNVAGVLPSFTGSSTTGVTVTLDQNQTVGGLNFSGTATSGAAYTIASSGAAVLTMQPSGMNVITSSITTTTTITNTAAASTVAPSTVSINVSAGNNVIAAPVVLNAPLIVSVGGSSTSLTMSGPISGAVGITKSGSNPLFLTGNNSYTGGVTINSGFVHANSDTSFGAVPGSPATNVTLGAGGITFDSSFVVNANRSLSVTSAVAKLSTNGTINTWAGSISGTGGIEKVGSGTLVLNGANSYTGNTTATNGVLVLGSSLTSSPSFNIASGAAATIAVNGSNVLSVSTLTIDPAAQLDVNDNDAIVNYSGTSPIGTIRGYLTSGFNNGNWNGKGIASTSAATRGGPTGIGYGEATDLGITMLDGVTIPGSAVIVKYTYNGDTNLNGTVGTDDFSRFLDGLATGGSTWGQGDFTYDGKVDLGNDFNLFLAGYLANGGALGELAPVIEANASLSSSQKTMLLAAVPEPASIALALIAAGGLATRRRRKA
jgi:autotransporter-associated beta strand protein